MCENNERKKLDIEGLEGLREETAKPNGMSHWLLAPVMKNKVKVNTKKIKLKTEGCRDLILDVIVPTEDRVEVKEASA